MSEEKPMKPEELSKFARPIADHLRSAMLDGTREPMERVQAAFGIQAIQAFIPNVPIRLPAELVASLPVPDDPVSHVEPFSSLTDAERALANQSLGVLQEFFTASAIDLCPDSRGLVLMEIVSSLLADIFRQAQVVKTADIDAHEAKRRIAILIHDRAQELLRPRDMALS